MILRLGRVIVRDKDNDSFVNKLVKVNKPILRIPNLCIHLRTAEERESFKVNKEDHLIPILCTEIKKSLGTKDIDVTHTDEEDIGHDEHDKVWAEDQEPELLHLLAAELNCDVKDIMDFELSLFDVQAPALSGIRSEFLVGARLDNLASCYTAVEAIVEHAKESIDDDEGINIVALFDHEEVGSTSYVGAGSNLIAESIKRITNTMIDSSSLNIIDIEGYRSSSISKSFIMSVDMAHAVHPNYASKHEKTHSPSMNSGIVIKTNSNQRYTTNGQTGFLIRELTRSFADVSNYVFCGQ